MTGGQVRPRRSAAQPGGQVARSLGSDGDVSGSVVSAAAGSLDAREAEIAQEVRSFRPLDVLFNQPTELPFQKSTRIRFVIASKDLVQAKASFADTTGQVQQDQAVLGQKVRAQLTGPDDSVKIVLVGKDERSISSQGNTTFEWDVTPISTGNFTLTLRLYNQVLVDGEWVEIENPPYVKQFQVQVSSAQRIKLLISEINGWLALLGSSLVALLGVALARLRSRFAAKKDEPAAK